MTTTTADRLEEIASELTRIAESFRIEEANAYKHRIASEAWWSLHNAASRVMHASVCSRQIDEPQCYQQLSNTEDKEQA